MSGFDPVGSPPVASIEAEALPGYAPNPAALLITGQPVIVTITGPNSRVGQLEREVLGASTAAIHIAQAVREILRSRTTSPTTVQVPQLAREALLHEGANVRVDLLIREVFMARPRERAWVFFGGIWC